MANPFVEIERKYREVAQSYQQGELEPEQFAEALEALRIQDDQEQWWQIQGNGKWLRFSGSEWEEASPPRPGPPPPPRAALVPPPRKLQPAAASAVKDVLGEQSPVHDLDDSIFFQTGVTADQIPALSDSEPAPGAFLIEEKQIVSPEPLPLQVKCQPLDSVPKRPVAPGVPQSADVSEEIVAPKAAVEESTPAQPEPAARVETVCPKCQKHLPLDARYCQHCGTKPTDLGATCAPESCPSCGQQLLPNSKFCGKCGLAIGRSECPKCHTPKVAGGRFCKGCGQAFG